MSPDDYIAIEKTLYKTRGGISFKTYNKDKSAKYSLNFVWAVWSVLGLLKFFIVL